jgi:hypothetical protein
MGVSYSMPIISQRSIPTETRDVGTSLRKRTQTPTSSKEELDEGKEELLSSDTLQIPFFSIPDDATISGKHFQEVLNSFFPQNKFHTKSPSQSIIDTVITKYTPLSSNPPQTYITPLLTHTNPPQV